MFFFLYSFCPHFLISYFIFFNKSVVLSGLFLWGHYNLKWTLFFIDKNGFLGKDVEGNRKILEKEEAFEIWEFLFENPKKIEVVPLTKLDILRKDFRGKKIEQITTTALGSRVVTILELKGFKEENERFFIEIEQEDGSRFWTQKSFSFEEILGMGFVDSE